MDNTKIEIPTSFQKWAEKQAIELCMNEELGLPENGKMRRCIKMAELTYHRLLAEQSGGMRPVRASDRLPEIGKRIFFEIHWSDGDIEKCGGCLDKSTTGRLFFFKSGSNGYPAEKYKDQIFWLEEQLPGVQAGGVNDGVALIAKERLEQKEKHGRTLELDREINPNGELCWAASLLLYTDDQESALPLLGGTVLKDWDQAILAKMNAKPYRDRLIIAGALIAAELDRLNDPSPSGEDREAVEGGKAKIYIASKTIHADSWISLRDDADVNIISTWIDEAAPGGSIDLPDLARRCINEAANADAMIVYRHPDEYLKGAFIEMGVALANKKPIYLVGPVLPETSVFASPPNVFHCQTIEDAIFMITGERITEDKPSLSNGGLKEEDKPDQSDKNDTK